MNLVLILSLDFSNPLEVKMQIDIMQNKQGMGDNGVYIEEWNCEARIAIPPPGKQKQNKS